MSGRTLHCSGELVRKIDSDDSLANQGHDYDERAIFTVHMFQSLEPVSYNVGFNYGKDTGIR